VFGTAKVGTTVGLRGRWYVPRTEQHADTPARRFDFRRKGKQQHSSKAAAASALQRSELPTSKGTLGVWACDWQQLK